MEYEEQEEYSSEKVSHDVINLVKLFVHFSVDEDGDESLRIVARGEKNQRRSVRTIRFITDKNVTGVKVVSILRRLLQRVKMPKGPLLRKCRTNPGAGKPWVFDKNDFTALFDDLARTAKGCVQSIPRSAIGSQSFRKFYASAMHEAGVPDASIQAVGYWWTDSFKIYAGASRMPRLRAQKPDQMLTVDLGAILLALKEAVKAMTAPCASDRERRERADAACLALNAMVDARDMGQFAA